MYGWRGRRRGWGWGSWWRWWRWTMARAGLTTNHTVSISGPTVSIYATAVRGRAEGTTGLFPACLTGSEMRYAQDWQDQWQILQGARRHCVKQNSSGLLRRQAEETFRIKDDSQIPVQASFSASMCYVTRWERERKMQCGRLMRVLVAVNACRTWIRIPPRNSHRHRTQHNTTQQIRRSLRSSNRIKKVATQNIKV